MQGDLNLVDIARELLTIHAIFPNHLKNPYKNTIADFELETFVQTWPNTTGGFEGVGGSTITAQRTYVFLPLTAKDEPCQVYFDGVYAYSVPCSEQFLSDIKGRSVKGVSQKHIYMKPVE